VLQRDVPPGGGARRGEPPHESFLLIVDAKTGKVLRRHVRPTGAREESKEAYATAIPYLAGKRPEILVLGGDCLTGYDADTGAELWRWVGYNPKRKKYDRIVASPVVQPWWGLGSLIYVTAPRGKALYAIATSGGKGALGKEHVAWKAEGYFPDVCTPALHGGRLYVLGGRNKVMTCLDAMTGEKKWEGRIGGSAVYDASPTVADGKVYCIDQDGNVVVLAARGSGPSRGADGAAGDSFKVLSRVAMGEGKCRSSIVVAGGRLFIRTARGLYCIGK
jgi:outer membrane protein assembly factor BamB